MKAIQIPNNIAYSHVEYEVQNKLFSSFIGKVIKDIYFDNENFYILFDNDQVIKLYHNVTCYGCDDFWIEEVVGNIDRLIGQPLTLAKGIENNLDEVEEEENERVWHLYKFGTDRESITIRFMGFLNDYSTSIDLKMYQVELEDGEVWNNDMFKLI